MNMSCEDKMSQTTQYLDTWWKYVETKYCLYHWWHCVIIPENVQRSNLFRIAKASPICQLSFNPSNSSRDDEEYLICKYVAEWTSRRTGHVSHVLTAAQLCLNPLLESPRTADKFIQRFMIRSLTESGLPVHVRFRISMPGGTSESQYTQVTHISHMWLVTYFQLYDMLWQSWPVSTFSETLWTGESLKWRVKHFKKKW